MRIRILFISLSILTLLLFSLDLAVGSTSISLPHVWAALTGGDCPPAVARIVINIRLIKAIAGAYTHLTLPTT